MRTPAKSEQEKVEVMIQRFEHKSWCHMPNVAPVIRDWIKDRKYTTASAIPRLCVLMRFYIWLQNNAEQPTVPCAKDAQRYFEYLRARGCRQSTIGTTWGMLKSFFDYLYRNDLYEDMFKSVHEDAGTSRERQVLNAQELHTLLDRVTDQRYRVAIMLMAFCGLRCIEVSELNWGDIHNDRAIVRGKGRKEKATPIVLPLSVQTALRELKVTMHNTDDEDPVITTVTYSRRVSSHLLAQCINQLLKKQFPDKPRISAHCLRHTAITLALESGMDVTRVSRFARHKSINTTMVYIHDNQRYTDPAEARIEAMVNHATPTEPNDVDTQVKEALRRLLKL